MAKRQRSPKKYIASLDMNGLSGRMLYMPPPKGKQTEILFVYGQHSSLERWWGLLQYANQFGAVMAPDLPGFGGMESFYKIGGKPTIDNFADYLAAFVKMRYKRKKVVIVGLSLGFVIATRMLQRYPELAGRVQMLVSLVGFVRADDLRLSKQRYWFYRSVGVIFSYQLPALVFRHVGLNRRVLRLLYHRTYLAKPKFMQADTPQEFERIMKMETTLWHTNDVRTHAMTTYELLVLDNCKHRVDVPVWHVNVSADQFLDHRLVEQHLKVVFRTVHVVEAPLATHAPSVIADEAAAAELIPERLRKVLERLK